MFALALACGALALSGAADLPTTTVTVDPSSPGLPYDGHGGLSAGASSRLLYDYDEPYRSDILDYLYKPKFGANLHVCKVEIGGDTQSTDGTEPSHMHTRDDLNCTRGYEWWLMKEAKKRNPDVVTYGLPWGAPGWINNQTGYYGPDQITYQVNWLKCARDTHGINVDWLGLWNERPWGNIEFVKQLRSAMDAAGLNHTRISLVDGRMPGKSDPLWSGLASDPAFADAFGAVGLHYPCSDYYGDLGQTLRSAGKKLWASEDWWSEADEGGAFCWAKLLNQNFVRMNITATISWSTIWSVYPQVDVFEGSGDPISGDGFWGPGLMYAWQPWSGHYTVAPTVWASAHTTQFVELGWSTLHGGSGVLAGNGSFLSFVSPSGSDFSVVVETGTAECHHCGYAPGTAASWAQAVTVRLAGSLSRVETVHVWKTTANDSFVQLPSVPVHNGEVTVTVDPQSIYTITTTTGQSKGVASTPSPPSARFPSQHSDDFESYPPEGLARFWADQCGSFQVMPSMAGGGGAGAGGAGQALRQRVVQPPGANQWARNLDAPLTVLGDPTAADFTVSASVFVAADGAAHHAPSYDALAQQPQQEDAAPRGSSAPDPPEKWVPHANSRVTAGRGDWSTHSTQTLSEAQAACIADHRCSAVVWQGGSISPDPNAKFDIWLTSKTEFAPSAGWQTFLLDPPRPPPPPPPPPAALGGSWGSLCGRVPYVGQNVPVAGVCLGVNATHWMLVENGTFVAFGQLHSGIGGFKAAASAVATGGRALMSSPVPLSLAFSGQTVKATVAGKDAGTHAVGVSRGMCGLRSGWNVAEFDDFALSA